MTIVNAYQELKLQLNSLYDEREAAGIASLVMEHLTGFNRAERLLHKHQPLTTQQQGTWQNHLQKLLQHEPVQYLLGEAWFAGMSFLVNQHVLIPRPETEELVEWVEATLQRVFTVNKTPTVLDIGTGSGCIPVAIKKKYKEVIVGAIDISAEALEIAKENAAKNGADINFKRTDILNEAEWQHLERYDIIVSNPPYIRQSEAAVMSDHVLNHEPSLALFVPDEDPLLFYRKIADFSLQHLKQGGYVFFEINEALGDATMKMLASKGFKNLELKKDLQEKDRMIKGTL